MPKSTWSFVGMQNTSLATSRRLISFGLSDARTDGRSGATSWMRGAIVKQRGSSINHILTHSKHGNCSLHWQRKRGAEHHEAQGLRQRHRLRLRLQEDCRSDVASR